MKLYNQTRKPLRFDNTAGIKILWDPYGAANVPDDLVAALKEQGFPVGPTPVAPETKAVAIAEDASAEQRSDTVEKLKAELATVKAQAESDKKTAEAALTKVASLDDAVKAASLGMTDEKARADSLVADKAALEIQLADTAKQLESATTRIGQIEAELATVKAQIGEGASPKQAKPTKPST